MKLIGIALLLLFSITAKAFELENNGYKDVVVTIHPDVPETNGQAIVDNIKV